MAFQLFEIQKQFMLDISVIELTQFEKTGSIGYFSNPQGNLET